MIQQLFASHAVGWMVLSGLLVSAGHLAGCDTSAPSQKSTKDDVPTHAEAKAQVDPDDAQPKPSAEVSKPEGDTKGLDTAPKAKSGKLEGAEDSSGLAPLVKRLVIASDIQEREPVELTDAKIEEPVVAFVELKNPEDAEMGVVVTFEHEGGQKVGFVELSVPGNSSRYRTWARTRNIKKPGEWTAVVKSKSGEELARKSFQVAG